MSGTYEIGNYTVIGEGRFDWQVWRYSDADIDCPFPGSFVAEAIGKPHWFSWTARRHMMREACHDSR